MQSEPPHQLDADGNPTVDTIVADRRRRRGTWPDLGTDPTHDTDIDAAVRARRNRKVTR